MSVGKVRKLYCPLLRGVKTLASFLFERVLLDARAHYRRYTVHEIPPNGPSDHNGLKRGYVAASNSRNARLAAEF